MEDGLDKKGDRWVDGRIKANAGMITNQPCISFLFPYLQAIQQEMEDGLDKKGDAKDFEEKLAEQLFADEGDGEKIQVRQHTPSALRLWL
jgi:hypothetical protein